jgi:hypothetical protein
LPTKVSGVFLLCYAQFSKGECMHITKIPHYIKKIAELGPYRSYQVAEQKFRDAWVEKRWRYLARRGTAAHTFSAVAEKYGMNSEQILTLLKAVQLPHAIEETILCSVALADQYVEKKFNLLGSGKQQFTSMPWHTDFRLESRGSNDIHFDATSFFKDISIDVGQEWEEKKDIKVPWELSRLQHVPVVGKAYQHTKNEQYAHAFTEQVTDWHQKNPFLRGINWLCPMEVGIRAANLVIAWPLFARSPSISPVFWQLLFSLLHDHLLYLENTWEIYDSRTSNHYLGDLIGYYYLCWLFKDLPGFNKKIVWCRAQLLGELRKQVLPDGADYEGSTSYHRLVTQMFYHAAVLSEDMGLPFDAAALTTIHAMHDFIAWCTPVGGKLVTIGDDDSGRLVSTNAIRTDGSIHLGLRPRHSPRTGEIDNLAEQQGAYEKESTKFQVPHSTSDIIANSISQNDLVIGLKKKSNPVRGEFFAKSSEQNVSNHQSFGKLFPHFGLSIYKTEKLHVTFRHHSYNKFQPSGHFHNDVGAVTLAVSGKRLLVDPGSYLYTPSRQWREYFRSVKHHSTFYIHDHEPIPFDDRLFALKIPVKNSVNRGEGVSSVARDESNHNPFSLTHDLYKRYGLQAQRNVEIGELEDRITITDSWHAVGITQHNLMSEWNFTLAPQVRVKTIFNNELLLSNEGVLVRLWSEQLEFTIENGWVAQGYGEKVPALKVRARRPVKIDEKVGIYIGIE